MNNCCNFLQMHSISYKKNSVILNKVPGLSLDSKSAGHSFLLAREQKARPCIHAGSTSILGLTCQELASKGVENFYPFLLK